MKIKDNKKTDRLINMIYYYLISYHVKLQALPTLVTCFGLNKMGFFNIKFLDLRPDKAHYVYKLYLSL